MRKESIEKCIYVISHCFDEYFTRDTYIYMRGIVKLNYSY